MRVCPSCGSHNVSADRRISGHDLVRCGACGLLVTQTTKAARRKYVTEKYSEQYTEDYKSVRAKIAARFHRHMDLMGKYTGGGKLLDVGCGTGYFLRFIKDSYPLWIPYGVEPSTLLRRSATRVSGVSVKNGTLDHIPFPDKYFDLVTCYDVLEHSTKLKQNLKELRRVLKDGGLLFIQSPNYDSLMADITKDRWDWWCIPDHVLHFSGRALKEALRTSGFDIPYSHTYEDRADFLSNIRGVYARNKILKLCFLFIVPFLLVMEYAAHRAGRGGLHVVLAKKAGISLHTSDVRGQ